MAGEYVKIKLLGADELNDTIKKLPGELQKKVYAQALRKGAVVIREEAKARAPYGTDFQKRSHLRKRRGASFVQFVKLRDEIRVTLTTKTDVSYAYAVHVGKAFWGMFQEFGTSKQPAYPWLRPAFDTKVKEALDTIGVELGNGVERTAEKLAGPLSKSGLVKRRR